MKLTHKQKLKLARSLLTQKELKGATLTINGYKRKIKTPPFNSAAWNTRKRARQERLIKAHNKSIIKHGKNT